VDTSQAKERSTMKRFIVLVMALCLLLLSTHIVSADPGTKVHNLLSGYGWYKAAGNSGVIQEHYKCNENWENCLGRYIWYQKEKHPEPPTCDEGYHLEEWVLPDIGDGSDILTPGPYWGCAYPDPFEFRTRP
jgi:hypothetical protein